MIIPGSAAAQDDEPVVKAVLFFSPNCPHCHKVIFEYLPPLANQYGSQLMVVGIDVSQPEGQAMYESAIQWFEIPPTRLGVPTLVIDDIVLVGSGEIPERFPGLVETYLAQGGVDWPEVPGWKEALEQASGTDASQTSEMQSGETETSTENLQEAATITMAERFAQDRVANSLAATVLGAMVLSLLGGIVYFVRTSGSGLNQGRAWVIPVICIIGLGVAGYLAYVEVTQTLAVCGPVGDCNTVQQSDYARLFGFLSIGVLGLIGYIAIILAWVIGRFGRGFLADLAVLAILGMATFGLLFSIYLTFLEPFVIGATCAWCLTSAILMTVLFWLSISPGKRALVSRISPRD
ncbi:MAG: hypothetical protein JXA13_07190 [Anaerolineales bacterium]|nr:hypothetical protein [Anaerolineales bacterium]